MYFDGALDKNAFRKLFDHSLLNGHREKSTFSNALPMVNYYIFGPVKSILGLFMVNKNNRTMLHHNIFFFNI